MTEASSSSGEGSGGEGLGGPDAPEDKRRARILNGPLPWEVFRFGTPLALGMALQTTFNLIDAYLIAQLPRAELGAAVGAIGICDQLAALATIVSYGVTTATSAMISRHRGAGDDAAVRKTTFHAFLVVAALGLVLGAVGVFGAGPLIRGVVGAKGSVADVGAAYLRVIIGGSFTIFLLLQVSDVQRALGSSRTPVALLVLGNALNVLFAIVFVFGEGPSPSFLAWGAPIARALGVPRMGLVGAAWATILARALVLVPNLLILRKRFDLWPRPGERRVDRAELGRIFDLAWPASAQLFLRISAMLLTNSLVARFFTTHADQTATTAMGLVFRLDTMALFVAMGWGSAAHTFVGQNVGAKALRRARDAGWLAGAYDAVTNLGLVAIAFLSGREILRVFGDAPAPLEIAVRYLHVVAPTYLTLGLGIVLGNAMAGAGATRTTLAVDAFVILGVQLPLSLVVVLGFGGSIDALFRAVAFANGVSAVAYGFVFWRMKWVRASRRMRAG